MDAGVTEGEALLAIEPSLEGVSESVEANDDGRNLLKLKKCSIRLIKLPFIEKAVEEGCKFIMLTEVDI